MSRRVVPMVLVVVATFITLVAAVTIWVSRQALETDQWTKTSSQLLEQPAIRGALSDYLTDQLYNNVDVAGELRSALPAQADALAGPVAGALRTAVHDVALKALETAPVQQAWQSANRTAHQQLLKVIDGGGNVVGTQGGVVTLDLKALLQELQRRVGIGGRLAGILPASAAKLTILRSDQLHTIQTIGKSLKPLAAVLVLAALALYAAAIALARDRRRETLRAAGIGFIFAGIATLILRNWLGERVTDKLASTDAVKPAIADTWTIGTSLLVDVAVATIIYGSVVVVGTWFVGPSRWAVSARSRVAPYLQDWQYAYGTLVAVLLLLFWWAPTEAFRRFWPSVILIALMAAGTEAVRRQCRREVAATAAPEPGPDGAMLERLDELHRMGGLDDAEYETAKTRVITKTGGS